MAKKLQKLLAAAMALSMCVSLLSLQALAAEPDGETTSGTVEVESKPGGGTETVDVTITVKPNNTTEKETAEGGDTTESGLNVNFESTETKDDAGKVISGESFYNVTNSDGTYGAAGGSEIKTEQVSPTITVDIPLTADDPTTGEVNEGTNTVYDETFKNETVPTNDGDNLKSENPAEYDQTTTTVVNQGSVTVTTKQVTVTTGNPEIETTEPEEGAGEENPVTDSVTNGYDYYWGDSGTWGYSLKVYSVNGEGEKELIESASVYGFNIYDKKGTEKDKTDDKIVDQAYCVDLSTSAIENHNYRIANLEDSGYYPDEAAEDHIRAIVLKGYNWTDGEDSLKSIMAMVKAEQDSENCDPALKGIDFTDFTWKEAATATQMAIWQYGNQEKIDKDSTLLMEAATGDDALNARINALYQYLIKQSLTKEDAEKQGQSTDIINQEKFIDEMSFVVGEKVNDAEANKDTENDNDVYDASVLFKLAVTPSTETDDLIVKVLDAAGNVVTSARLAGKEDSKNPTILGKIYPDEETGTYTLSGLTLTENQNISFNLKIEGAQYLQEGVYIYMPKGGNDSSQTFVTMAEGKQSVDVNMSIDMTFNVEESTITTERTWRDEWYDIGDDDDDDDDDDPEETEIPDPDVPKGDLPGEETPDEVTPGEEIIDPDVPTTDIPDEDVPQSDVPKTGDMAALWLALSALSGTGLAGVSILGRKKRDEE